MKKILLIVAGVVLAAPFFVSAQTVADTAQDQIDCAIITHNLKLGSRDSNTGGDVTVLQTYLSQANFLDSDPTGYFGRATRKAVQDFQTANGISPLGSVGPLTRTKIQAVSCTGSNNANTSVNTPSANTWAVTPSVTANQVTTNTSVSNATVGSNPGAYTPTIVQPVPVSATIDQSSLSATSGDEVAISGNASNSTGVIVALVNSSYIGNKDWATIYANHSYVTFTNNPPAVSNNRWTTSFSGIGQGNYTVLVYDHSSRNQQLLASGNLNVVGPPSISIIASSVAVSPAMTMSVQYNNMPVAGLHIINSSGATVWTQELTSTGGSGSTVVPLSSVLPAGNYIAQAFGINGRVYATSNAYYFTPPVINYTVTVGSTQSITLAVGQSATDGGLRITLASITNNLSGQPVANFNIESNGFASGFYSATTGSVVAGGGGFGDTASPNGSATITVTLINSQSNFVTIAVNTGIKG